MKSMKKTIAVLAAISMIFGCVIGGTLAWLIATDDPVTNTFSTSTIGVDLKETERTYQMVPGWKLDKDPSAMVTSGSEEGYLFVKVEKSANFDTFMDSAIDVQWTPLTTDVNGKTLTGVYYIKVDATDKMDKYYNILGEGNATYNGVEYTWADNQVLVKPTVTKEMMSASGFTQPTMKFTAYASQLYKEAGKEFTAAQAWANAQPTQP